MGKFEVLSYLQQIRANGDDGYYRYAEIYDGMRRADLGLSYSSIWRSMLSLWRDELLEVEFEGEYIRRNPKFRARLACDLQLSILEPIIIISGDKGKTPAASPKGETSNG